MLCFVETYGPTLALIRGTLARLGVTHTMLSIEDDEGIERVLAARKTRIVYFESPTNPVTRIADIARITKAAHAAGALTVMDNTFAGFHNHGQYGVDIFVHSLTKYASGHGDVMGGAVIARKDVAGEFRREGVLLGPLLDPHAAFLVMRGMKTYYLRYEAQAASAHDDRAVPRGTPGGLARALPGTAGPSASRAGARADAGIRLHRRFRPGARRGGRQAVRGFARVLRDHAEPRIGRVAGDAAAAAEGARATAELQAKAGIGDGTIRLSIGIEDTGGPDRGPGSGAGSGGGVGRAAGLL